MITHSIDEVIEIHDSIIEESGGLSGVKDYNALESSLNNCFSTFFGEDLYKTTEEKLSNIFYLLIKNHCFNDANKRTAVLCFFRLVCLNNVEIEYEFQELEDLALGVAESKLDLDYINRWIEYHRI